jgi:hypothetical protein
MLLSERTSVLLMIFVVMAIFAPLQAQDFFPLQVGNTWRYAVSFMGTPYGYQTWQILRDSTMPNAKKYYLTSDGRWVRIDTNLNSYTYDRSNYDGDSTTTEVLMDKFKAAANESWVSYRASIGGTATMKGFSIWYVFGDTAEVKMIRYQDGLFWLRNEYYSRKHGLIEFDVEPSASYILVGAKINGIVYGDLPTGVVATKSYSTQAILRDPYPNPFNSSTMFEYEIPSQMRVSVRIYDVLGRMVRVLEEGLKQPGVHHARWDLASDNGRELSSGVYFVLFETQEGRALKKVVAVR